MTEPAGDAPELGPSTPPRAAWPASRDRALAIAHAIAHRLADVDAVLTELRASPSTLGCGLPGIALFFIEMSKEFPGENWDDHAYSYMRRAADLSNRDPIAWPGLLEGTAGLAVTLQILSNYDHRFVQLLLPVTNSLVRQTLGRRPLGLAPLTEADYDWVNGAAGILRSLTFISAGTPEAATSACDIAIQRCRDELLWLVGDVATGNRWTIPPTAPHTVKEERLLFPDGYVDLGLAHGLAGVLASLALATMGRVADAPTTQSIRALGEYILRARSLPAESMNWPRRIASPGGRSGQHAPARTAWCYGAGGISHALMLAARATEDDSLKLDASRACQTIAARSLEDMRLESPSLCHGFAGLLCILVRLKHDAPQLSLDGCMYSLLERIEERASPEHKFIVREVDPVLGPLDDPGLLTGAAGVGLALITASTMRPSLWDLILGLS